MGLMMVDQDFIERLARALAKWIVPQIQDARPSLKKFLTVDEAAEFLGCSRNAVYHLVTRRKIPVVRWGRSLRFEIKSLMTWSKGDKS
jgi:excisionase family DNA binding protein